MCVWLHKIKLQKTNKQTNPTVPQRAQALLKCKQLNFRESVVVL